MDATGERQKSDPAEGRERVAAFSRQERLRSRSRLWQRPAFVKLNAALRCPAERSRSIPTPSKLFSIGPFLRMGTIQQVRSFILGATTACVVIPIVEKISLLM